MTTSHLQLLCGATGFPWEFVDGDPEVFGGKWQLMPANPKDDGAFWFWHLTHAPQWFTSRQAAAENLLRSWAAWQQRN